jgi:hypothetical protein
MNGSVKFIGTNAATRDFHDREFENCLIKCEGVIHSFFIGDNRYLLDIKETRVFEDHFLFFGMMSDDSKLAGNVAIKFFPKKSIDKEPEIV